MHLRKFYARSCQHQLGSLSGRRIGVFVGEVYDFLYTRLDYRLGAFVAREEGHVDPGSAEILA